jgi:hypothetical protein
VTDDDLDAHDRAIARAMDVDGGDATVDDRLVDDYREVLAQLPADDLAPRAGLEDQVVAAALARRPAGATALDGRRATRGSRARTFVLVASGVAAVVVAALLITVHTTPTSSPTGRIANVASNSDVDVLLHQAGSRSGSFTPPIGKVVLAPNGSADVFGLLNNHPVDIVLETDSGSVAMPTATPQNGVIAFNVTHPDLVRAVRLTTSDGVPLGRAQLS